MSYIALYRKWRPLVFEDVVEQEHVVKTLKNAVNTGRIAHAYLFCGTRGTGKTTMAKIFARAINCLNPKNGDPCNECEVCKGILSGNILDVVEIDAASNNSVDNVREIRDEVVYVPSQAKYKVYIIDEVHMLSTGAFNALLKTLEEPPGHVVFILATTEPHKLPATILSRCQRFDFRRISLESIIERLNTISQAGGVKLSKEAARLIAKMSDGALRDAISILDQCIAVGSSGISYDDVLAVVGIVNDTFISGIIDAINEKDVGKLLGFIEELVMQGKDISQFVSDLVYYYRNLLICKVTDKPDEIIDVSSEVIQKMREQCVNLSQEEITLIIKELSALESGLKWATHPRVLLEVSLIKLCENNYNRSNDSILERLAVLEKKITSGNFSARPAVEEKVPVKPSEAPIEKKQDKKPVLEEEVKASDKIPEGKYLECWEEILTELKKSGRMVIYTNLIGTKAIEIDNRIVGIVFGSTSKFNRMVISKAENLEVVEAAVGKKLGREVRLKCLDEEGIRESQKLQQKEKKDEFVEKAKDLASRLNVPINIIDG